MERGVLVQRSMGPRHIIIGGISAQDPAQVRFAKHDHVVETFAADRADESLNVSILPGRSGCDRMVPNAHCTDPLQKDWTIRGVSIPNEMSRRVVPIQPHDFELVVVHFCNNLRLPLLVEQLELFAKVHRLVAHVSSPSVIMQGYGRLANPSCTPHARRASRIRTSIPWPGC